MTTDVDTAKVPVVSDINERQKRRFKNIGN